MSSAATVTGLAHRCADGTDTRLVRVAPDGGEPYIGCERCGWRQSCADALAETAELRARIVDALTAVTCDVCTGPAPRWVRFCEGGGGEPWTVCRRCWGNLEADGTLTDAMRDSAREGGR